MSMNHPLIQKSYPYIMKYIIDTLGKVHPSKKISMAPGGRAINIWSEAADVKQWEDYYNGKRKTRPTAKSNSNALLKQEEEIASGEFVDDILTPEVMDALYGR